MNKNIILTLAALMLTIGIRAQQFIELQDLEISRAQQTYGAPVKNRSVTGENLSVNGENFKKGIGVHAESLIKIKMNNGHRFSSKIGVNDSDIDYSGPDVKAIPLTDGKRIFYRVSSTSKQFIGVEGTQGKVDNGSVIFKVLHNGKEVYNSGVMRQGDKVKNVDLEVKRGILELVVENAGDGASGDHAVWAEPKIEYMEIAPTITEQEFNGVEQKMSSRTSKALEQAIDALPEIELPLVSPDYDWLINNIKAKAEVYKTASGKDIVLSNGLIARTFRVLPNLATIDYLNQMTGESLLRAVSNEGILTLDGVTYPIGGLSKQPEYGYTLMKWVNRMSALDNAFLVNDFEIKELTDRMAWKRERWASNKEMPKGKELIFTLKKDDLMVKVHFALYDGIPTLSKWIEVFNEGDFLVQLNSFKLEQLAMVEGESLVGTPEHWVKPNIHIESDYAFGGMQQKNSDHTTYWEKDPRYTSQTNYPLNLPALLEVKPPLGPDTAILPGESLTTFRVWETPLDSREEERKGLFLRKMYRTISPWVTENPIFMHVVSSDETVIKNAIDQCVEVGYEMIILSFGSGVNMEDESEANYAKYKELVDYADSKGIELGGYSLLSSRWISDEIDVINPETGKRGGMIHGSSPCLASEWGYDYFRKIKKFYEKTGMSVFENDGSYPGNVCASTIHSHHNGLNDSQWKQYTQIQNLYQWMRGEGIYMNVPDFYINSGSNKTGIGYREVNWSLPRERQLVLGRQNIYDGLWDRTPSMCWTFTPLTQYHGGGAAATIEPLNKHLTDYKNQMIQNYGSGVQSAYRGPRLYDTQKTKRVVKEVIDWYKRYRYILNSDVIHLRRPSGRDWDGFMHVNPKLEERGFALFFNPTDTDMVREISLPLYYTGLTETASVREKEGKPTEYKLSRDYKISLKIKIPANSYNWLVIEE
ncbi:NPCBM/NEW2 domain-containing protein [Salegentibacter maritimus]|uniref:NPCBM/NEW2 domain-containing protein n=1 Tax=Salegentibacter maritimus TaxID=2794347 RepID=UPI0018E40407|nr:NPCBM/NEW2 domain-containing protein [Salegentibacter maritimus]MBI6117853.1 NPCBM/NEW2 domain-containing protein [Salegentibacter maritimus]